MPVTIRPFEHAANPYANVVHPIDTQQLLRGALTGQVPEQFDLYQSTWGHSILPVNQNAISASHGFVDSIVLAWNQHHHLTLRPDDVWLAILSQFNLFVLSHAEELRFLFVNHEGQEKIRLEYQPWAPDTFDFTQFVLDMGKVLEHKVLDKDLRKWMIPEFSTTQPNDVVVASIMMMGTLQKYFSYECGIVCGFPSVTLLGEKADYEDILTRIDKLDGYGAEPMMFATLLRPVIKRFIASFDNAEHPDIIDFWRNTLHVDDSLCGVTAYTGWITAFCFWDENGKVLYPMPGKQDGRQFYYHDDTKFLHLDGVEYKDLDAKNIPPASVRVPVHLESNWGHSDAELNAGLMAMELFSTNGTTDGLLDSVTPIAAWWITEDLEPLREETKLRSEIKSSESHIRWLKTGNYGGVEKDQAELEALRVKLGQLLSKRPAKLRPSEQHNAVAEKTEL